MGIKYKFFKIIFAVVFLFFLPFSIFSEEFIDEDYGYTLDLPEGFAVSDMTEDGMSYMLSHSGFPVDVVIKLYEGTNNSEEMLTTSLSKLGASHANIDSFKWRNVDCNITQFSMFSQYDGWALSVPLTQRNTVIVLLCYAPSEIADSVQQFMVSCINSLAVDRGSYSEPGPVTTYAFPKAGKLPITLEIDGNKIATEIDGDDVEAAKFVVECEWAVLSLYVNHAKWQEAWQRYYKLIFRDSVGRTKRVAFDIYNALQNKANALANEAAKNASSKDAAPKAIASDGSELPLTITTTDPKLALMQLLLSWTQKFPYERGLQSSADFTPIPACLIGDGNDCDSRAILLCAIAKNLGIESALFVSREYAHALYGVALDAPGAKMKADGKDFLVGETTTPVAFGLVAQSIADPEKWIAIPLY